MTRTLIITSSPRGQGSKTTALAETYIAARRMAHPDEVFDRLDLAHEVLPEFDGDKAAAKMNIITGQSQNGAEQTAWDQIVAIANRFAAADRYVFAVPMWNGGIPYRLKQYIDLIHQPGLLFGLDPEKGYFGLLKDKSAILILSSGVYAPDRPSPAFGVDHHGAYLSFWLAQAGVADVTPVRFQPSLLTADPAANYAAAEAELKRLAL